MSDNNTELSLLRSLEALVRDKCACVARAEAQLLLDQLDTMRHKPIVITVRQETVVDTTCEVEVNGQLFRVTRSEDNLYRCQFPTCCAKFTLKGNAMRHYAVHGATKMYPCTWPECTRRFAVGSSLKRHLLVHSGERPFACQHCQYSCNSRSGLKVHARTHTGEKPYACKCEFEAGVVNWGLPHPFAEKFLDPIEDKLSDQIQPLDVPLKNSFPTLGFNDSSYLIDLSLGPGCQSAFTSSSNLVEHRRVHTGEKPYLCNCEFRPFPSYLTFFLLRARM